MSNSRSDLHNWRTSIEIDYLALYIKTWFAFLSSLQKLYPSITGGLGDGKLVKHYSENISLPNNYDQEIKEQIEKAFIQGKDLIKRDLEESFFGIFYRINKSFVISQQDIDGHTDFKIQYRSHYNNNKCPNLFIYYKSTQKQFKKQLKCYHIETNLKLETLINSGNFNSSKLIIDEIIKKMREKGYELINQRSGLSLAGINKRKALINTYLQLINQNLRPPFRYSELFEPQPIEGFPQNYDDSKHKLAVIKWFIHFNYKLRNILFHYIIDPFDKKWLYLFKNTYLALKEIVDHNIYELENS